jgi:hypothetical protein
MPRKSLARPRAFTEVFGIFSASRITWPTLALFQRRLLTIAYALLSEL